MAAKKKLAKKVTTKALVERTPKALRNEARQQGAATAPAVVPKRTPTTVRAKLAGVPDMTPKERLAAAKAHADKINKAFKGDIVVAAEDAHGKSWLRRPSGIMQLDVDTGGGLPAASLNTISGPNNAGKSTLMYCYFAEHQRLYGDNSFIAVVLSEGNLDYDQARRCSWIVPYPEEVIAGKRQARLELGEPDFTEEELAEMRRGIGVNHIVYGLSTAEEMLDVTESLLRTNLYGLIGLDSYEGLMPNAEAQLETLEDHPQQGARATAIGRFLQHYGPIKRDPNHYTTVIMTCQIRFNRKKQEAQTFMQKYLKDWAEVVPDVLKHWRTIAITLWASGKQKEKVEKIDESDKLKKDKKTASSTEVVGKDVHWEITKGKDGTHDNIMGSTTYWYDERCFDIQRTIIHAGMRYGVLREIDGQLTLIKNGAPHEYLRNIPGADMFVQALREEPEMEWDARHVILHAIGKDCLYR